MKNLAQITENQDIITKEYLVAGYEPLLPVTPLDPTTKFLNGNRTWATIETSGSPNLTSTMLTLGNYKLNYNSVSDKLEFLYIG